MLERGPLPTRRAVTSALVCAAVGVAMPRRGHAEGFDDPPALRTPRHQFELLQPAEPLPAIPLSTVDGKRGLLAGTPGVVTLVNIWATWCPACRTDLPMLDRFQAELGSRIAVVAVSIDRAPRTTVKAFLDQLNIRHLRVLLDPTGKAASSTIADNPPLRIYAMPTTYLVTPSGRVAGFISGEVDWLVPDARRLLDYYAGA